MLKLPVHYAGRAGKLILSVLPDAVANSLNLFANQEDQYWEEVFALWSAEWEKLPQEALELIGENAPHIHDRLQQSSVNGVANTEDTNELWRRVFDQAGLKTDLVSGTYQPSESSQPTIEHSWLQVEGCLVDPTAGQYGKSKASFDYYDNEIVDVASIN